MENGGAELLDSALSGSKGCLVKNAKKHITLSTSELKYSPQIGVTLIVCQGCHQIESCTKTL